MYLSFTQGHAYAASAKRVGAALRKARVSDAPIVSHDLHLCPVNSCHPGTDVISVTVSDSYITLSQR